MNIRRVLIVLFVLLCVGVVAAEPAGEVRDTADRLAASIYTGPAMRTLRQLSDGFGGRLSRSPAYNHAAEWAAAQFRSYGIQNARLEPFTIPNGWVRGTAHGQMRAPISHALHLESLGWSPSTPPRRSYGRSGYCRRCFRRPHPGAGRQVKGQDCLPRHQQDFRRGMGESSAFAGGLVPVVQERRGDRPSVSRPGSKQCLECDRGRLGRERAGAARRADRNGGLAIHPPIARRRAGDRAIRTGKQNFGRDPGEQRSRRNSWQRVAGSMDSDRGAS